MRNRNMCSIYGTEASFSQLAEKFLRCWESLVEKWCGYLATTTSTRCKGGDMKDRAKE